MKKVVFILLMIGFITYHNPKLFKSTYFVEPLPNYKLEDTLNQSTIKLFTTLTKIDETEKLIEDGFQYSQILKLKLISNLTQIPILNLIDNEHVVKETTLGKKRVHLGAILSLQAIDEKEILNEIKEQWHKIKQKIENNIFYENSTIKA